LAERIGQRGHEVVAKVGAVEDAAACRVGDAAGHVERQPVAELAERIESLDAAKTRTRSDRHGDRRDADRRLGEAKRSRARAAPGAATPMPPCVEIGFKEAFQQLGG
jgi:hypothetical protein